MSIVNSYIENLPPSYSDPNAKEQLMKAIDSLVAPDFGKLEGSRNSIKFINPQSIVSKQELLQQFFDYEHAKRNNKNDLGSGIEIQTTMQTMGKSDIRLTTVVFLTGSLRKVQSSQIKIKIQLPAFQEKYFNTPEIPILTGFPLSKMETINLIVKSIALAINGGSAQTVSIPKRQEISVNNYFNAPNRIRLIVNNHYAVTKAKLKIYGLITLTKKRPILVTNLTEPAQGTLQFQESKITDINFSIGDMTGSSIGRYQRNFNSTLQLTGFAQSHYTVIGNFTKGSILGNHTGNYVKLVTKRKDINEHGEFKFFTQWDKSPVPTMYIEARKAGRMFHPGAFMLGEIEGQKIELSPVDDAYNALQVFIDGRRVAIFVHSPANQKHLKKGRKLTPIMCYSDNSLSKEELGLVLQSFQFHRIGSMMKTQMDDMVNRGDKDNMIGN